MSVVLTKRDRKKIIEAKKYLRVKDWDTEPSYWVHLWARFTFRNPWKLWPPFLRDDPAGRWLRTCIGRMEPDANGIIWRDGKYQFVRASKKDG